jgi:phosphotriesterase-related protein
MLGSVQTVRGTVSPDKLGRTLSHEHVFGITPEVVRDYPDIAWAGGRDHIIQSVRQTLTDVVERGFQTIVDCTCINLGRDIPALIEANDGIPLNIVISTGLYTSDYLHFFYQFHPPVTSASGQLQDILIDMFVRDITVGIQGTPVRAGMIKCVTDKPGMTPNVERVLRATARAHRETGVPITAHTDASQRNGLDQQRLFLAEGVDLSRVVIGHSGDTDDFDYLMMLLDAGSYLGADRFGLYREGSASLEKRVHIVAELCARGYASQLLLSHDAFIYQDWYDRNSEAYRARPKEWVLTHISDAVLPALLAAGVPQSDIDLMLIDNPRRLLANNQAY